MQTDSVGDNLHEMPNMFTGKNRKKNPKRLNMSSGDNFHLHAKHSG